MSDLVSYFGYVQSCGALTRTEHTGMNSVDSVMDGSSSRGSGSSLYETGPSGCDEPKRARSPTRNDSGSHLQEINALHPHERQRFTFESVGQRRTGSHHGNGGRRRESSIRNVDKFVELTRVVMAHMVTDLCESRENALAWRYCRQLRVLRFKEQCYLTTSIYYAHKISGKSD